MFCRLKLTLFLGLFLGKDLVYFRKQFGTQTKEKQYLSSTVVIAKAPT